MNATDSEQHFTVAEREKMTPLPTIVLVGGSDVLTK